MARSYSTRDSSAATFGILIGAVLFLAWLTHVIVCIKTASWLFLIAGAIMSPIAIVHGIGIWFGAW